MCSFFAHHALQKVAQTLLTHSRTHMCPTSWIESRVFTLRTVTFQNLLIDFGSVESLAY